MALGGATKKLQQIIDTAEDTYRRLDELREQIVLMRETLTDTHRRVRSLERELDDQRALVEALAHEEGIDVDRVLAEAAIEEAEPVVPKADSAGADTEADATAGSDSGTGTATDGVGQAESGDDAGGN